MTPRDEMLSHAYGTDNDGMGPSMRLVSGIPIEVYRAALDEIRSLNREIERLESRHLVADPFEVVLTLLSYGHDKASNRAWARCLCNSYGLNIDDVQAARARREARRNTADLARPKGGES